MSSWLEGQWGGVYFSFDESLKVSPLFGKEKAKAFAEYKKKAKRVLIIALILIVSALIYCKFSSKAFDLLQHLSSGRIAFSADDIIIPLGISYYTFSSIAYLLDIYWRKIPYEKNYFKLALCMIYFPHIVQGPISRYNRLLSQFESPEPMTYKRICFGLQLMVWGYFKKMVIADRLAILVNEVFGSPELYSGGIFIFAMAFAVFQLYADFSGCMDIVSGASSILGIELDKNFDHPFFSTSIAEFWRRWHATLGSWFKDYIYLPIAVSPRFLKLTKVVKERFGLKASKNLSVIVPLSAVWILTGIWHGTGWNYVLWGIYFGIIIIFSNVFKSQYIKLSKVFRIDTNHWDIKLMQMIRTFILFMFGRFIVLSGTLEGLHKNIIRLLRWNPWVFVDGSLYEIGLDRPNLHLALLCIVLMLVIERLQLKYPIRESISKMYLPLRWAIYYAAIFSIIIFGIYGPGYDASAFVYMQF